MTVVCQWCGAEFERKPEDTNRVFYSPACYHKFKTKDRYFTCPHNEGVECAKEKKKCHRCGWNPVVAKCRKNRLLCTGGETR